MPFTNCTCIRVTYTKKEREKERRRRKSIDLKVPKCEMVMSKEINK
ncbi:hypothetical protein ACMBCN_02525 [Candidatus Liberibacter asiaticus]